MQKIIKPWQNEDVPVIGWKEYLKRVREQYEELDENSLRSVTAYLHIMGDVSTDSVHVLNVSRRWNMIQRTRLHDGKST